VIAAGGSHSSRAKWKKVAALGQPRLGQGAEVVVEEAGPETPRGARVSQFGWSVKGRIGGGWWWSTGVPRVRLKLRPPTPDHVTTNLAAAIIGRLIGWGRRRNAQCLHAKGPTFPVIDRNRTANEFLASRTVAPPRVDLAPRWQG